MAERRHAESGELTDSDCGPAFSTVLALDHLTTTLLELTAVFALSVAVGWGFLRLRMPPLVGYLCAGALVGPQALGLVHETELVEQLAEVGVIVLLFAVGLELSVHEMRRMWRQVLRIGSVQVLGTMAIGTAVATALGTEFGPALFAGGLLALSSTATISRLLVERGDFNTPPGRAAFATCIAQDLAVVPMVLMLPLLAGKGGFFSAVGDVAVSLLLFGALAVVSWWCVPRLLDVVARCRSRELYLLALLTSCLAVAVATALLGMSFALGAFLVGSVVGSSLHHHRASSEVEPLRDALASLFFFSIGMLFDPALLIEAPLLVSVMSVSVLGGKAAVAYLAVRLSGAAPWVALRTALMLAQVGEFSFVLARIGTDVSPDLLSPTVERAFLVVAVISIALTPALFAAGRRLVHQLPAGTTRGDDSAQHGKPLTDHVVVVGYGPVGRELVTSLRELELPYRVVELNPDTVRDAQGRGVTIVQGDATRANVLRAVRIYTARMLVIATSAPSAVPRIVRAARDQHPSLHVLVRANYLNDVPQLQQAGVDDIVPQELETGVHLLSRCLRHLLVPEDDVLRQVDRVRSAAAWQVAAPGQDEHAPGALMPVPIEGLRAAAFRVEALAAVDGKTLGECQLRRDHGISVVALSRDGTPELHIGPETELAEADVVVCIGSASGLSQAAAAFRGPAPSG